jgi:hypothetical protein
VGIDLALLIGMIPWCALDRKTSSRMNVAFSAISDIVNYFSMCYAPKLVRKLTTLTQGLLSVGHHVNYSNHPNGD